MYTFLSIAVCFQIIGKKTYMYKNSNLVCGHASYQVGCSTCEDGLTGRLEFGVLMNILGIGTSDKL